MSDTKITETYEFNTNILTSYSGREQRIKTRQYPRHMFSYDYDGSSNKTGGGGRSSSSGGKSSGGSSGGGFR